MSRAVNQLEIISLMQRVVDVMKPHGVCLDVSGKGMTKVLFFYLLSHQWLFSLLLSLLFLLFFFSFFFWGPF